MAHRDSARAARARTAPADELPALVHDSAEAVLLALLENPHFEESHLLLLLERKNLTGRILEAIAHHKEWMGSYPVKLRVAAHPHTPRLAAIPLIRQLYLFDLANLTLQPAVPAELKRLAEEQIVARLEQLPLGQKLTLARRGSARIAGALLAEGHPQVVPLALDNGFLTEAQVLKVLARDELGEEVVSAVARHGKWSALYNVRMGLVRHPATPLARLLAFLPDLTLGDLRELSGLATLSPSLRQYIEHEIAVRSRRAPRRAPGP
jgi:hypothetical protein